MRKLYFKMLSSKTCTEHKVMGLLLHTLQRRRKNKRHALRVLIYGYCVYSFRFISAYLNSNLCYI